MNGRWSYLRRALLVALIVWGFWPAARGGDEQRPPGLGERLLGPVSSLASSAIWVRFDLALREGEPARAYALAERALELDPGAWQGWSSLGLHLVFERGSGESELDPAERRRWIRAGLEVLQRGAGRARRPGELHLLGGVVLAAHIAPRADELGWPGGAPAALRAALPELDRAVELGIERAPRLAEEARQLLAGLDTGGPGATQGR